MLRGASVFSEKGNREYETADCDGMRPRQGPADDDLFEGSWTWPESGERRTNADGGMGAIAVTALDSAYQRPSRVQRWRAQHPALLESLFPSPLLCPPVIFYSLPVLLRLFKVYDLLNEAEEMHLHVAVSIFNRLLIFHTLYIFFLHY